MTCWANHQNWGYLWRNREIFKMQDLRFWVYYWISFIYQLWAPDIFQNSSPLTYLCQGQELTSLKLPGSILTPMCHFSFYPGYKPTRVVFPFPTQWMGQHQSITLVSSSSCLLSSSICWVNDVFPLDSWLISDSFSSSCLTNSPVKEFDQERVRTGSDTLLARAKNQSLNCPILQRKRTNNDCG